MLARECDHTAVENAKVVGANVISFELVLNKQEMFVTVGCYFPPSDEERRSQRLVEQALWDKPKGSMPLIIGDLNADLYNPRNRREEVLSQTMGEHSLECASHHLRVQRHCHVRGRWTWRQEKTAATRPGDRRWIRSRPDYFLIREEDRKRIKW